MYLLAPENYIKVRRMELTEVKFSVVVNGFKLYLSEKFA